MAMDGPVALEGLRGIDDGVALSRCAGPQTTWSSTALVKGSWAGPISFGESCRGGGRGCLIDLAEVQASALKATVDKVCQASTTDLQALCAARMYGEMVKGQSEVGRTVAQEEGKSRRVHCVTHAEIVRDIVASNSRSYAMTLGVIGSMLMMAWSARGLARMILRVPAVRAIKRLILTTTVSASAALCVVWGFGLQGPSGVQPDVVRAVLKQFARFAYQICRWTLKAMKCDVLKSGDDGIPAFMRISDKGIEEDQAAKNEFRLGAPTLGCKDAAVNGSLTPSPRASWGWDPCASQSGHGFDDSGTDDPTPRKIVLPQARLLQRDAGASDGTIGASSDGCGGSPHAVTSPSRPSNVTLMCMARILRIARERRRLQH